MLIFGLRSRATRRAGGTFHCPHCGADREFSWRGRRTWFCLFFVPVFPSGGVRREIVVCDHCQTGYDATILAQPTMSDFAVASASAFRWCACAVLAAAGGGSASARALAVELVVSRLGAPDGLAEAELDREVAAIDPSDVPSSLTTVAGYALLEDREHFLADCADVAARSGPLTVAERSLLGVIGEHLGLSPAHVLGVIETRAAVAGPGDRVDPG